MFSKHIQTFSHTLDGLRSFVDLVEPFLDRKHLEVHKKHAHAGNLIPLILAHAKIDPSLVKSQNIKESDLRKKFNGNIEIKEIDKEEQSSYTLHVSGPQSLDFNKAMSEVVETKERVLLLYQNSLISLISAVECFLSQIIHTYYNTIPETMSDKDKVFSFDDLKKFDTVEDARVYLIEKKVTDLMRGSFTDWINFFKTQSNLTMSYLKPYIDTLVETCERRNLLIHNAGIVNSIYLSKVSLNLRKGTKKGEKLDLTRKYLDERIDNFHQYCILIVSELWKKLKPLDENRANILAEIAYNNILQSRWGIAEGISYFMMMDKKMKEPMQLVGTLNYWQCVKRQGRWEEVKSDVEVEDFSAKGIRYQLGHLALLEKKKEFFALVPVALAGKEISIDDLREYPIFENMRKDRRFASYKPPLKKKTNRKRTPSSTAPKKVSTKKKATAKKKTVKKKDVARKKPAAKKKTPAKKIVPTKASKNNR